MKTKYPKQPGILHFACGATLVVKQVGAHTAGSRLVVFSTAKITARPSLAPGEPATCIECPVKHKLSGRQQQTGWLDDVYGVVVTCRVTRVE